MLVHSLSKSMIPISTYVGGPAHGDDDPGDDDSKHDDEDHANKDTRDRDHGNDEGSIECTNMKRKKQVSQNSGPIVGSPKMPRIDPTYYFWNGKTASLRDFIDRWRKLLDPANYSPASAVNFILSCIPRDKQHLVSDCTTAEEALQELGLYATEATTNPTNIVEAMKSHRACTTHAEDKIMISLFEKSLADITKLDSAYILNLLTAQQLCSKFSTIEMRTKYIKILLEFQDDTSDKHGIINYLPTMKQIIIKAKMDLMDIEKKDSNRNGQLHGNKDTNKQKNRRGALGGSTNGRPINLSKHTHTSMALHPSTRQFNTTMSSDISRRASRGSMGAQRGRGLHQTRGHVQGLQTNRGTPRGVYHTRGYVQGLQTTQGTPRGVHYTRCHVKSLQTNRGAPRGLHQTSGHVQSLQTNRGAP